MMKKLIILLLALYPLFTNGQSFDIADEEKFVYHDYFRSYKIFHNIEKNTFFIIDENKRIIVENLKFCKRLSMNYIQAIDENNKIVYYDIDLNILDNLKPFSILVCGTVTSYNLKLIKEDNQYLVETTVNRFFSGGENTTRITAAIEDQGFDKIYFINGEQSLYFSVDSPLPEYLIYEKNNKYGIINEDQTFHYDTVFRSINMFGRFLKVEKSGLYNYYHLSPEVKYKRLDDYEFNLAYFELENGEKGYVDLEGNEYYF